MKITDFPRFQNILVTLALGNPAVRATVSSYTKDQLVVKVDEFVEIKLSVEQSDKAMTQVGAIVLIAVDTGEITLVESAPVRSITPKAKPEKRERAGNGRSASVADKLELDLLQRVQRRTTREL